MSNSALDAGIPVLTEIIDLHAADDEVTQPLYERKTEAESDPQDSLEVVEMSDIDGWLNAEWSRLERRIGGRILHQVMASLETDIENRVRDALADVLQVAVESLATDIKQKIQDTLEDVISQAIKEEVFNMKMMKE